MDYVAQELQSDKVNVKLDRWNLRTGKRLWEQIASFISEPAESDARMIYYTTQASLASEKDVVGFMVNNGARDRLPGLPWRCSIFVTMKK